jgi:glycine oxidase
LGSPTVEPAPDHAGEGSFVTTQGASHDVLVIGGGVIGLAIAWRTALRGMDVGVVDPQPGSGASHYAAGMLAPVTEAHYGEEGILALNLASVRRYPSFVEELEEAARTPAGYRECGTLAIAFDADDRAALEDLRKYQESLGLVSTVLTARECRRLEPFLAPQIRGGLHVEGDHQINNRQLVDALLAACNVAGVVLHRRPAREFALSDDRVVGVDELRAEQTVLAAGCRSREIAGLPDDVLPPVRPVKGQILRLHGDPAHPVASRTVRASVHGRPIYVVPRVQGEIVVGATSEEFGFDQRVTVGGVWQLLSDARELLPGLAEIELAETSAGLRPGSPDNAPMIGPSGIPGLVIATGHYRNGILLTPVTADAVSELLATGKLPDGFAGFDPRRFAGAEVGDVPRADVPLADVEAGG